MSDYSLENRIRGVESSPDPLASYGFTRKERTVAMHLAAGLSVEEIVEETKRGEFFVRFAFQRIQGKVGAPSWEATIEALRASKGESATTEGPQ